MLFEPVRSAEPPIELRQQPARTPRARLRRLARGHGLAGRRDGRDAACRHARASSRATRRACGASNSAARLRIARRYVREARLPSASSRAPRSRASHAAFTSSGITNGGSSQPEILARRRGLGGAERGAVRRGRALHVRRTVADDRSCSRSATAVRSRRARPRSRARIACGIVAVDVRHDVPAVGLEALRRVVGEPAARRRRRSRCRCRRRRRSACRASACPRTSTPRARCLPSGSRRRGTRTCSDRRSCASGRLNSAARCFSASAMPTAFASPWPSGPVVVSMPSSSSRSGWPATREPSWRKFLSSSTPMS